MTQFSPSLFCQWPPPSPGHIPSYPPPPRLALLSVHLKTKDPSQPLDGLAAVLTKPRKQRRTQLHFSRTLFIHLAVTQVRVCGGLCNLAFEEYCEGGGGLCFSISSSVAVLLKLDWVIFSKQVVPCSLAWKASDSMPRSVSKGDADEMWGGGDKQKQQRKVFYVCISSRNLQPGISLPVSNPSLYPHPTYPHTDAQEYQIKSGFLKKKKKKRLLRAHFSQSIWSSVMQDFQVWRLFWSFFFFFFLLHFIVL